MLIQQNVGVQGQKSNMVDIANSLTYGLLLSLFQPQLCSNMLDLELKLIQVSAVTEIQALQLKALQMQWTMNRSLHIQKK